MSTRLTRQSFANSFACPRLGWFSRQATPPVQLSPEHGTLAERYSSEEQREVHARARALFPDAAMVTRQAYEAACWQTQDLLERPSTNAILEAAFATNMCRARADALVREGDSWHLYEVKASTHLTSDALDDVAFVWMVLDMAGVDLGGASVLLVSRDFRAGMPDGQMYHAVDVSEAAKFRAKQFAQTIASTEAQTRTSEPPLPRLIPHCRRCRLFESCAGAGIRHPIFELPLLDSTQLTAMLEHGYKAVTDIPDAALLKRRQQKVWQSIVDDRIVVCGDLHADLETIQWPVHYLDVDTVGTALPLFPGIAPFEQLPYLYSVRLCSEPGKMQAHRAFLSPHDRESTHEMAERLLQDIGTDGSVVVYSPYLSRTLRWMAKSHSDLSQALLRLEERLVSLETIIRRDVYHPGFHGKTSLRAVLAAMVPGLSYIDLEIEDAASASASFAYLSRGVYYSPARAPLIRRDLYAYCARDTLGMMRLHEALIHIDPAGSSA
ncbi:MAG: DUF2779 domain-containing protein [Dehalococcoidia bacterium]|nr:DUF2779 domain-containing protein [Dehalococcoidia bacterium]